MIVRTQKEEAEVGMATAPSDALRHPVDHLQDAKSANRHKSHSDNSRQLYYCFKISLKSKLCIEILVWKCKGKKTNITNLKMKYARVRSGICRTKEGLHIT